MKTFEQLEEQITPEIIKKMCELAEGFAYAGLRDFAYPGHTYSLGSAAFPLLLHRTAEGWNNITGVGQSGCIFIQDDCVFINSEEPKTYLFNNYQPSHLTPREMAILDCLIGVLK